jgi:hypothetical protein
MVSQHLLDFIAGEVRRHCAVKGYVSGPNWNPLTPRDSIAALAMARSLLRAGRFDHYLAIAPEGHVYGYFFERLGARVLSVAVDYPPRRAELVDDLSAIRGRRVLLVEDDIISGVSLGLVVSALATYEPRSVSLYLGRDKEDQHLQNVPPSIAEVYLAEDHLDPTERGRYEADLLEFFGRAGPGAPDPGAARHGFI